MSLSDFARVGGGLTSAAVGVLLLLGHLLDLGGDPEHGTVLGKSLVLAAHQALVFALVTLGAAQSTRGGPSVSLGMVLGVVGTTLVSGVVLVEIAGASGAEMDPDSGDASTVKLQRYDKRRKKWRPVSGAVVGCGATCETATLDPYGASATLLLASTKHRATVSGTQDVAGNFMLLGERSIFTTGTR